MIFRQVTEELVMLLAYEATRDLAVVDVDIQTPVTATTGKEITNLAHWSYRFCGQGWGCWTAWFVWRRRPKLASWA